MLTIYNYTSLTRELYLRQERKVGMWDTGAGGGGGGREGDKHLAVRCTDWCEVLSLAHTSDITT